MSVNSRERSKKKALMIKDVLTDHSVRQLPVIPRDTPLKDLAEKIEWFRHSRQLYVVDREGRLMGNITIASLVKHIFVHHHGTSINPRHLLAAITAETAEDLMLEKPLSVKTEDSVDDILEKMVDKNVEEVPVLDDEGKVIGDVTMIDLMKAYKGST
jgi:CBS domain-containing protein